MLLHVAKSDLILQEQELPAILKAWCGALEQVDDILVMGFRV